MTFCADVFYFLVAGAVLLYVVPVGVEAALELREVIRHARD